MQIQKQKLCEIASNLSKQLDLLNNLSEQKRSFAKKINYQIPSLFSLLSSFPTVSYRQLTNIFDAASIRLLIQNKKYLTMQDLCKYLGISEKHALNNNNKSINKQKNIEIQIRYQLEDIMEKQIDCMEKIRQILKVQPYQVIFGEIDFFNNGYINSNSLIQFIEHYCPNKNKESSAKKINIKSQQDLQSSQNLNINSKQLRCIQVIKYLKGSATAQKIFFVDFAAILQQNNPNLNPQSTPALPNHSLSLSRSFGHIARVSELQLLHSRQKKSKNHSTHNQHSIQQSNLQNYTLSNGSQAYNFRNQKMEQLQQYADISTIKQKQKVSYEQIEKINKIIQFGQKVGVYEQKICANHWRNTKYLERLKIQTNISNFKTNTNKQALFQTDKPNEKMEKIYKLKASQKYISSFHPSKENADYKQNQKLSRSQILYQFRYIAQIYDKHRKQVEDLLNQNEKFTIINGFNVMDVQDRGYISLKQLKQFLYQIDAVVNQNKILSFFNALARVQSRQFLQFSQQIKVITYPQYALKIFKLKILQNTTYKMCRRRKPLVNQSWPDSQQKNYCRFIRSVILIFHELETAKKLLRKMFHLKEKQKQNQQQAINQQIQDIRRKMQQIFEQSDIHYEKFKEIIGKNCETFIGELYKDQVILEPKTLLGFLYQID